MYNFTSVELRIHINENLWTAKGVRGRARSAHNTLMAGVITEWLNFSVLLDLCSHLILISITANQWNINSTMHCRICWNLEVCFAGTFVTQSKSVSTQILL